ncbi:MAG: carboxymuconolactone decarboxylase family protein [Bauldia sp.]|nr:carboxymuconolactone decarboxylase family protein [Bauldia sp.]
MPNTPKLPSAAARVADSHAAIWKAYSALGKACSDAGPLDPQTICIAKLALAIGPGLEGAVHSHARRGQTEGLPPEGLQQTALLAIPTLGLAQAVRALTWIEDVTGDRRR